MKSAPPHYRKLVESMPAIPWILDWRTKRFSYIGPQVEELLGWPRENWQTVDDWVGRIHPLDRERIVRLYLAEHQASVDFESEYTVLTRTGGFVLVRDFVHIARNAAGGVESLMGFIIAMRLGGTRASA